MGRINFDLQELQAFVAVAERASFRAPPRISICRNRP